MKMVFVTLAFVSSVATAQTINTPSGSYQVGSWGSTTVVTQTSGSNYNGPAVVPAVPVTVNPATGIGQVITPSGTYMVQRSGNTTTVIQTSRSR